MCELNERQRNILHALDAVTEPDKGWGGSVSAGFEVARHGRFAFDVEGRAGFIGEFHTASINLGFHWY